MTDILTLSLTHGRRSFSVLHDPARLPSVRVALNDGEYRPGMVNEITALAELMPKASLEELLDQWRGQARLVMIIPPKPTFWPTLSVTDCADACRIIFDHFSLNPSHDALIVEMLLNEKGFGEVADEMRRRRI